MKGLLFLLSIGGLLLSACGDPAQRVDGIDQNSPVDVINTSGLPPSDNATDNVPDTVKRCYQYTQNRDTIYLQVLQTGKGITGTMQYHLYEKDRNDGVINGTAVGDTLVVDYTFQSEGTVSTREVVLVKKGSGYMIGTGKMKEQSGKMVFEDRAKLKFEEPTLALTSCIE